MPVPADPAAGAVVLAAVSGRGPSFDPWELQLFHGAGHLAAWLVELERARQAGSSPGAGARVTDGVWRGWFVHAGESLERSGVGWY